MNHSKQLADFIRKAETDSEINPPHISLYMALFVCWRDNNFKNPVSITREEVMRMSKIKSRVTYHSGLKTLHARGYIQYEPSFHPVKGSQVYLNAYNFHD